MINRRWSQDDLNYSTGEDDWNTEKCLRDQKRLAITQTPVKDN